MPDSFATLEHDPRSVTIGLWTRRAIMTLLAVIAVLALLNRFGQHPALEAGDLLRVWLQFEVNPTTSCSRASRRATTP